MSRAYTVTTRHRYATCRLRQRLRDRNRSRNQGWMLSDTQRPVRMSPGLGEFELRRTMMRLTSWTPRVRDSATFIWKVKLLQRVCRTGKAAGIPTRLQSSAGSSHGLLYHFRRMRKFQFTVRGDIHIDEVTRTVCPPQDLLS